MAPSRCSAHVCLDGNGRRLSPGEGQSQWLAGKRALSQRSRACPCGSEVGVPLPRLPPAAHESGFPAPAISLLPASQAVLQTQVGNDRFFSLGPPLAKPRKVCETRSPRNVQASIGRAWQGPAVSQPALLTKTSAAQGSHELVSSVSQHRLYLFSFLQKINPKVGSESDHSGSRAFSLLEAGLVLGGGPAPVGFLRPGSLSERILCWKGCPGVFPIFCFQKDLANPFQTPATLT